MEILDRRQETLVARERALLGSLAGFLEQFGAPMEDVELVGQALFDVEAVFMLVVAGEFDSGKTAFIDALIGTDLSDDSVAPSTGRITLIKQGPKGGEVERRDGVVQKTYPSEFLQEVCLADTPITNAIARGREDISREFVPPSDLVLFVASAERPLTESGIEYLKLIHTWGKKVVVVVNKADLLPDESDRDDLRKRVEEAVQPILGVAPPVFFVESFKAQRAKVLSHPSEREDILVESGFAGIESRISEILDDEHRVRVKLENPLGVIQLLNIRYQYAMDERLGLLDGDAKTLLEVEEQFAAFDENLRGDFNARMTEIQSIVSGLNRRGDAWFEKNIRLGNAPELAQSAKIQARFRQEVLVHAEKMVDEQVEGLVGWMVDETLKQWRSIVDYIDRQRQVEYEGFLFGDGFEYDRDSVIACVGENVRSVVKNYDEGLESEKIAQSIRDAVVRTAVAEVGAVGMGAAAIALVTAATLSVTFTVGTVVLAGVGLMILPNQRRRAREDFRAKTEELHKRLGEVFQEQFEIKLAGSVEKMREALAPYSRFVHEEQARMSKARKELDDINAEAEAVEEEISTIGTGPGVSV